MVAIVVGQRPIAFAKYQMLSHADHYFRVAPFRIFGDRAGCPNHAPIELNNSRSGADRHIELDVGHAEHDPPESVFVGRMAADAVAPWRGRLDVSFALGEREPRAAKAFLDARKPL